MFLRGDYCFGNMAAYSTDWSRSSPPATNLKAMLHVYTGHVSPLLMVESGVILIHGARTNTA